LRENYLTCGSSPLNSMDGSYGIGQTSFRENDSPWFGLHQSSKARLL
jgi:hypothetical protein